MANFKNLLLLSLLSTTAIGTHAFAIEIVPMTVKAPCAGKVVEVKTSKIVWPGGSTSGMPNSGSTIMRNTGCDMFPDAEVMSSVVTSRRPYFDPNASPNSSTIGGREEVFTTLRCCRSLRENKGCPKGTVEVPISSFKGKIPNSSGKSDQQIRDEAWSTVPIQNRVESAENPAKVSDACTPPQVAQGFVSIYDESSPSFEDGQWMAEYTDYACCKDSSTLKEIVDRFEPPKACYPTKTQLDTFWMRTRSQHSIYRSTSEEFVNELKKIAAQKLNELLNDPELKNRGFNIKNCSVRVMGYTADKEGKGIFGLQGPEISGMAGSPSTSLNTPSTERSLFPLLNVGEVYPGAPDWTTDYKGGTFELMTDIKCYKCPVDAMGPPPPPPAPPPPPSAR